MIANLHRAILGIIAASIVASAEDPWAQPRELSQFQALLDRSPFSLPTVEESSPLADRFTLTGAVSMDGEPMVFVLDKSNQSRHMLTRSPNKLNMQLVEYLPDIDARKMKATIKVDGQVATIAFADEAPSQQVGMGQPIPQNPGGMPGMPGSPAHPTQPTAAISPGNPNAKPGSTPPRRVIRRRVIANPSAPVP